MTTINEIVAQVHFRVYRIPTLLYNGTYIVHAKVFPRKLNGLRSDCFQMNYIVSQKLK